ncbi:desulfoferrodoxin family protein [Methanobrevibacter filiformis]
MIEREGNKVTVKVGEVTHPMEEEHHISFIELISGNKVYIANLTPGDEPKAEFEISSGSDLRAREYCNIHGLWEA